MRVNLRKRVAALLIGAGLLVPSAAWSADLNVNLVANPGFEDVDTGDAGPFTSVRIQQWADADGDNDDNFAYPYSSNYSGIPAPAGAGDWHFTGGFGTAEGQTLLTQSIDLSSGAVGTAIAGGSASYQLSGFFSSYLLQGEASIVRANFLDGTGASLGVDEIGGPEFLSTVPVTDGRVDWGMAMTTGRIPAGTASVDLEIVASGAAANFDGYLDNVSLMVVPEPFGAATWAIGLLGCSALLRRRNAS
jgi:hypothetical protein